MQSKMFSRLVNWVTNRLPSICWCKLFIKIFSSSRYCSTSSPLSSTNLTTLLQYNNIVTCIIIIILPIKCTCRSIFHSLVVLQLQKMKIDRLICADAVESAPVYTWSISPPPHPSPTEAHCTWECTRAPEWNHFSKIWETGQLDHSIPVCVCVLDL